MFLVVLEGMVYTVGAIFAAAALYLGKKSWERWRKIDEIDKESGEEDESDLDLCNLSIVTSTLFIMRAVLS